MRIKTGRTDQAAQDHETVMRVRAALDGWLASHGREVMVSAAHVRDLLDPRGLWSLDPERGKSPETPKGQSEGISPTADPITGCEPVTPRGAGPGQPGS